MAEWVRLLAWTGDRTVPAEFESNCGKRRFRTLAIMFTPLCQCLSEETLKAGSRPLLSGVYARGSKRSHQSTLKCVTVVDSTTHSNPPPPPPFGHCGIGVYALPIITQDKKWWLRWVWSGKTEPNSQLEMVRHRAPKPPSMFEPVLADVGAAMHELLTGHTFPNYAWPSRDTTYQQPSALAKYLANATSTKLNLSQIVKYSNSSPMP